MKKLVYFITLLMSAQTAFSQIKKMAPDQTKVDAANESLKKELEEKAKQSDQKMDDKTKSIMANAIEQIKTSGMLNRVPKKGDKFLPFALKNFKGEVVNSTDMLAKNQLVVTFYQLRLKVSLAHPNTTENQVL